jgi:hypothetical protein
MNDDIFAKIIYKLKILSIFDKFVKIGIEFFSI